MAKQTYWLSRGDEPMALVEGAAERDEWVRVHGYVEAAEPDDQQQVHAVNEATGGRGQFPYGVVKPGSAWASVGWRIADPPAPVDLTRDSHLFDQPAEPAASEPAKPKTPAATAASTKEQ